MPVALTSDERQRLAKLAGLLGSSFEGERLNALAMIEKMARQKNVRVDELLLNGQTEVVREVIRWREAPPKAKPDDGKAKPDDGMDWKSKLRTAAGANENEEVFMTDWEVGFATDLLAKKWAFPTEKQTAVIDRIWAKYLSHQYT